MDLRNFAENVFINYTLSIEFIAIIALDAIILYFLKIIKIYNKINYRIFIIMGIIIYAMLSVVWINRVSIEPIDDSKSVNDLAIKFVLGDEEGIRKNEYLEKYPSQIGVVLVFSFIYKIFGTTNYKIIQYINIVSNVITILVMFAILKKLSKKYNFSELAYFFITLTFVPLIK